MKKYIAVATVAGLFSIAAFAQTSNPQAAPVQGAAPAPAPMAQTPAPAPVNQPARTAASVKRKHHHHRNHHKAASVKAGA
ncbi:hypothetical protein C5O80_36875 [Burkholderia sp. SRS-46]|nr:hypothetical protein C5O80_36875 [Burkholderia sp. SRS-46]